MRKLGFFISGLVALCIILKIIVVAENAPEKVTDILSHWAITWLKGGAIATTVTLIIFGINKKFSKEETMSRVGMFSFVILIPLMLWIAFGFNLWLLAAGAITGIIIGYFSYIIDDHLLEAWELRQITLPVFIGIGFGGSVAVATLLENWQDENIFVTEYATCKEVTIQRYTQHTSSNGKTTTTYYSWDFHKQIEFINRGEIYPNPIEGVDYELGHGALWVKDRAIFNYYKWIGGNKLKKDGTDLGHKWIILGDTGLVYKKNILYDAEENYFGHAIVNGKERDIPFAKADAITGAPLPTSGDVPGPLMLFGEFFKVIASNPDFSLLRWIYLLVYFPFFLCIFFIEETRLSFLIFVLSSTIVILIIFEILLRRSGKSIADLGERFHYGGGSTGGGGAYSSW